MNGTIHSIAEQYSQPGSGVYEQAVLYLRPYIEDFLDTNWLESKLVEEAILGYRGEQLTSVGAEL